MTIFQIITLLIAGLTLFFGIVGVYIKTQIDIAKIQTTVLFIQRDLDQKEISICKIEKNNREDHQIIFDKLDKINKYVEK